MSGHSDSYTTSTDASMRWLEAMERAGVRDLAAAEPLALAAYRCGDVDKARRWLKVAKGSPVSQWIQAKLLLREGKVDRAAALLARVSHAFPLAPSQAPGASKGAFQDSLYFRDAGERRRACEELWGELGVLRLARREYAEALEALLRAGFWEDAAYVAERILTTAELKAFVDLRWSDDPEMQDPGNEEELGEELRAYRQRLFTTRGSLRHLLARRLTRESRGHEARIYVPDESLAEYESLMGALDASYDSSKSREERAQHFVAAARVARHHGLALLATELEPDYAIHGGAYAYGLTRANRTAGNGQLISPSKDELRRTAVEPADPPRRYHYRFVGAELGWAAAQLLADGSDEKARILCEAGGWIKYLNPSAADRFYKELVRKCRKTAIGQWADYIRWFPLLDENGALRPSQPGPPRREPPPEPPESDAEEFPIQSNDPSLEPAGDKPIRPDSAQDF